LFRNPEASGVINLSGVPAAERRSFVEDLLPRLAELGQRTGRPHWLVIDTEGEEVRAQPATPSVLHITTSPKLLSRPELAEVNLLLAQGNSPERVIQEFCQMTQTPAPTMDPVSLSAGEVLAWRPQVRGAAPLRLRIQPHKT
jgi:hypothetical protein